MIQEAEGTAGGATSAGQLLVENIGILVGIGTATESGSDTNPFSKLKTDLSGSDSVDPIFQYDDAIDTAACRDVNYGFGGNQTNYEDHFNTQIQALEQQFVKNSMSGNAARALSKNVGERIKRSEGVLSDLINSGAAPEVKARLSDDAFYKLTMPGYESLTSPLQELHYEKATFVAGEDSVFRRSPLPKGVIVLTTKRLIFFSEEPINEKTIVQERKYGLRDPVCTLKWKEGANAVYFPIPLSLIRSVEIVSNVACETNTEFVRKYRFWGLGSLFESCAPLFCSFWQPTPVHVQATLNENRSIQLGVCLPPWGEKTVISIQLPHQSKTEDAVDFVSKLQKSTKHLYGISGN